MLMDHDADHLFGRRAATLLRRWRWIIAGAGACATVALVVSLFLPKIYRATTYIMVSESKITEANRDTTGLQLATLPTFLPFVDNDSLIDQSLRKFHLDGPPYKLTVDRFRRRHYLDVQIPKSTRLLELDIEFPDAKLAADIANDLAQRAVEFNDRMNATDTVSTQAFLKKRLDEAARSMAESEVRRLRIQEEASLEDREKELGTLLAERDHLMGRLGQMQLDYAQDESKSKTLEQALAGEPRMFQLKKSVTAEPLLEKAAAAKIDPNTAAMTMTEDALNITRQEIQNNLVNAQASSAAERAGTRQATERLREVNAQIGRTLTQLTRLRSKLEKADRDYVIAGEALKNASRQYQEASVTVSSKSQDLKQIAPALTPERPVRPKILLNTVLGFVLGIFLFAGLVLAIESFRELHHPRTFAMEEIGPNVIRGR